MEIKRPTVVKRIETFEFSLQEVAELIEESFELSEGKRVEVEFLNIPVTGSRKEILVLARVISEAKALAS